MVEALYLDTAYANAEQAEVEPSYSATAGLLSGNVAMLRRILEPQMSDVQAQPFMDPDLAEADVVREYRAGRTRSLEEFIASLEARGEI